MSNEVAIPRMDISSVVKAVSRIEALTERLDDRVATLADHQVQLREELQALSCAFLEFVAIDKQAKALQLAETRLVKVRQEIETKFGFYAVVRRRTTGILQGVDAGVVTHDVLRSVTEDMMVSATGYWLAPALVATASWARDDRVLADRALDEALKRDSFKTSLFMALVTRRLKRETAAAAWLGQYFLHQDPLALDREFIVLLDSVANGAFGGAARVTAANTIHAWLSEMGDSKDFVSRQEASWRKVLSGLAPPIKKSEYALLREHSPTWPLLEEQLSHVRLHGHVQTMFEDVFRGEIKRDPKLEGQVDELLDKLVTHFDAVELPLRCDERRLELIIEHDGNEAAAEKEMGAEQAAHEEHVALTDLLTNAAMFAEQSHASTATQRFSIALSRDWIVSAHDALTASYRRDFPKEIEIVVGGWQGTTCDGRNESDLLASLDSWCDRKCEEEVDGVTVDSSVWLAIAVGALAAFFAVAAAQFWVLLATVGLGLFAFVRYQDVGKKKAAIREDWQGRRAKMKDTLRATVAQLVDYLCQFAKANMGAETVRDLLCGLSPEQFALAPKDTRTIVVGNQVGGGTSQGGAQ